MAIVPDGSYSGVGKVVIGAFLASKQKLLIFNTHFPFKKQIDEQTRNDDSYLLFY